VLELAVLGLLKEQPLHGYELKKRLSDTLGSVWGVSYGSLYPALSRLEKAGAIEVVDPQLALARRADSRPMPPTGSLSGEAAAARRRRAPKPSLRTRKAYRITERGDALFGELLAADETSGSDEERSFALKLAFCRYLPTEGRIELLQRRRARLADRLARNRRALAPREQTPAPVPDLYTRSLLEHRTESTIRELVWVDNLIAAERQSPPEGATA
jgi:DNA-binding PadR family transcriptional regulator